MNNKGRSLEWQSLVFALVASTAPLAASAQSASVPGSIFSCTTADGRKLTSDRPIVECMGREQRVHNRDGSVRAIHPPTPTAEERADQETRQRKQEAERLARQDAVRRDRNLIARYPDEAAHQRAREAALDTVRAAMKTSENRMRELALERKPLLDEAEFYKGRDVPAKLKAQLDANDVAAEAQRSAVLNQEAELDRINRLYDAELVRLRKLWGGATPGSLGALPPTAAASSAVSRASSSTTR